MLRLLSCLVLLIGALAADDVIVIRHRTSAPACTGICTYDAGYTVQASGHTCTISSITLATGDSVVLISGTASQGGTVTAKWNNITATEYSTGPGDANGEIHAFESNNVTGATGNAVFTRTNAGDDAKPFNCVAIRITGLASHAVDQHSTNNGAANTAWGTNSITTTHAAEAIIAVDVAATNTGTAVGAWQNGFTRLNRIGNATGACCVIDYGSKIASSIAAFQGYITGNASATFYSYIGTFY